MTLLDAPVFDAARDRRNQTMFYSAVGLLVVLFIGSWLVSGHACGLAVELGGRIFAAGMTANHFLERGRAERSGQKAYARLDARSRLAAARCRA